MLEQGIGPALNNASQNAERMYETRHQGGFSVVLSFRGRVKG